MPNDTHRTTLISRTPKKKKHILSAYSHLQFNTLKDQCVFASSRHCDSLEDRQKRLFQSWRHLKAMQKDQNPTEMTRDESEVHRDVSSFWTSPNFSGLFLRRPPLSRGFLVESELLSTWLWHQSSAGSASSLTSEERSSVLLNNRWPTLESNWMVSLLHRGWLALFLLRKWFCLSVCSTESL